MLLKVINAKLNYYLTKGVTTNTNFINSITKFLINDTYEENNKNIIKRHNYITKTFLKILDSDYFKEGLKWIKYADFVDFEKQVIKECYPNDNNINIDELIKYIDNFYDNEINNLNTILPNYINSNNNSDNELKGEDESFSFDNENFNNNEGEMTLSEDSLSNEIINNKMIL